MSGEVEVDWAGDFEVVGAAFDDGALEAEAAEHGGVVGFVVVGGGGGLEPGLAKDDLGGLGGPEVAAVGVGGDDAVVDFFDGVGDGDGGDGSGAALGCGDDALDEGGGDEGPGAVVDGDIGGGGGVESGFDAVASAWASGDDAPLGAGACLGGDLVVFGFAAGCCDDDEVAEAAGGLEGGECPGDDGAAEEVGGEFVGGAEATGGTGGDDDGVGWHGVEYGLGWGIGQGVGVGDVGW